MPFRMFKAFSGSRNRRGRGDPATLVDYPEDRHSTHGFDLGRSVLRRASKRKEPIFTPLPSRVPTNGEDYHDGFIRVDSPSEVMGGALNVRPTTLEDPLPPPVELDGRSHISMPRPERERSYRTDHSRSHPYDPVHTDLYHGRSHMADRRDPVVIAPSSSSGSPTPSERYVDNPRSPPSVHPEFRVVNPAVSHHRSGISISKTPNSGLLPPVVHEVPPHRHHSDSYPDRYGRGHRRDPPLYYIVPGGMSVIFQDQRGNMISSVGDLSGRHRTGPPAPFIVQDRRGRELYRYDGHEQPRVVQVDLRHPRHESSHSAPIRHPNFDRRHPGSRYDYRSPPDDREFGYRGEHRDHGDHRRHGDDGHYQRHDGHRSYRGHREYDTHRDHEDHRRQGYYPDYRDYQHREPHGRADHMSRRGSLEPRRAPSLSNSAVVVEPSHYQHVHSDPGRSEPNGAFEGSIHSGGHIDPYEDEGEEEISHGMDAVHI